MAFQAPQQRPTQRPVSVSRPSVDVQVPASPARKRTIEESQEWILFSPDQNADTASRTSQTPRTATYLSDLGSLETHVRSQPIGSSLEEGDVDCQGTEEDDDVAELDSLDDGLRAFQHDPFSSSPYNRIEQSGDTLLPRHDGLGTFTSSAGLQEQLWQFERYNPHRRRHVRRRSSIQRRIDEVEEEQELDPVDERTARIEKWRLEQSKAVLEEIEKETRRRRRRMSRMRGVSAHSETKASVHDGLAIPELPQVDSVIYEEPEVTTSAEQEQEQGESWWRRITRRVIQDLIGLDDNTLSVIFGEELASDPSPTPKQASPIATAAAAESRVTFRDQDHTWEAKLMERIAKELGILVHQLSEHDRAFSTYQRLQEMPEYAGLNMPQRNKTARQPSLRQQRRQENERKVFRRPSDALLEPTMPRPDSPLEPADTSLWGIEEEAAPSSDATRQRQEREYWERDVDVGMIFSYLRRRFASNPPPPPTPTGPLPTSWTTASASASATRAEQIRQHHPLVSRAAERAAAQSRRRESLLKRHHMQVLAQRRAGSSSCASQSTKRSRVTRSRSASSRHYWDLGPSGGSGSAGGFSNSPLGAWGEV